jgi:hypothetical protein
MRKEGKFMNKWGRGRQITVLAVFIVAVFSVTQAHSDLVYSSFGPSDTFGGGLVFGSFDEYSTNPPTPVNLQYGFSFTPTFDATLDSIKFAAFYFSGSNALDATLMSDSNGLPGTALETFTFTGLTNTGTIYTANSLLHAALNQGTQYWFVLAAQGDGMFAWSDNQGSDSPLVARRDLKASDTGWNIVGLSTSSVFAVNGTPVPIPAAAWLLGSGLVGMVAIRRRTKP